MKQKDDSTCRRRRNQPIQRHELLCNYSMKEILMKSAFKKQFIWNKECYCNLKAPCGEVVNIIVTWKMHGGCKNTTKGDINDHFWHCWSEIIIYQYHKNYNKIQNVIFFCEWWHNLWHDFDSQLQYFHSALYYNTSFHYDDHSYLLTLHRVVLLQSNFE